MILIGKCYLYIVVSINKFNFFICTNLLINAAADFPKLVIAEEREWEQSIKGSNAVVNLAGMPISTRWSPEVGWC